MEGFNSEKPTLMALRKRAGLTQLQLAVAMGKAVSTISNWETGKEPALTPREFRTLKGILDCTYDELIDSFSPPNAKNA